MKNRRPKRAQSFKGSFEGEDKSGKLDGRSSRTTNRSPINSMWGLAGMGIDLSAAVAGFTLLGWWADRHWQTSPRYTLAGVILGLIGGMYNLIRRAIAATRDAEANRREHDGEDS